MLSLRKIIEDSVGKFVLGPDVHPLPSQRAAPGALTADQAREFPNRWKEASRVNKHIEPLTLEMLSALSAYDERTHLPEGPSK